MSYILNQYNKIKGVDEEAFMQIIDGEVEPIKVVTELGSDFTNLLFYDEALMLKDSYFNNGGNYFFHCKIRSRVESTQEFLIKLVNVSKNSKDEYVQQENFEQYIKTFKIDPSENKWVDLSFMFCPLANNFNAIKFEYVRTPADYSQERAREASIIYEELSLIKNIIMTKLEKAELLKLGVQANPGLRMCINNEEIYVGRSGAYEIRSGLVTVSFFSVVEYAKDADGVLEQVISELNQEPYGTSRSLVKNEKTRVIDDFSLDYIYEVID